MYCPNCGKKLQFGIDACPKCQTELDWSDFDEQNTASNNANEMKKEESASKTATFSAAHDVYTKQEENKRQEEKAAAALAGAGARALGQNKDNVAVDITMEHPSYYKSLDSNDAFLPESGFKGVRYDANGALENVANAQSGGASANTASANGASANGENRRSSAGAASNASTANMAEGAHASSSATTASSSTAGQSSQAAASGSATHLASNSPYVSGTPASSHESASPNDAAKRAASFSVYSAGPSQSANPGGSSSIRPGGPGGRGPNGPSGPGGPGGPGGPDEPNPYDHDDDDRRKKLYYFFIAAATILLLIILFFLIRGVTASRDIENTSRPQQSISNPSNVSFSTKETLAPVESFTLATSSSATSENPYIYVSPVPTTEAPTITTTSPLETTTEVTTTETTTTETTTTEATTTETTTTETSTTEPTTTEAPSTTEATTSEEVTTTSEESTSTEELSSSTSAETSEVSTTEMTSEADTSSEETSVSSEQSSSGDDGGTEESTTLATTETTTEESSETTTEATTTEETTEPTTAPSEEEPVELSLDSPEAKSMQSFMQNSISNLASVIDGDPDTPAVNMELPDFDAITDLSDNQLVNLFASKALAAINEDNSSDPFDTPSVNLEDIESFLQANVNSQIELDPETNYVLSPYEYEDGIFTIPEDYEPEEEENKQERISLQPLIELVENPDGTYVAKYLTVYSYSREIETDERTFAFREIVGLDHEIIGISSDSESVLGNSLENFVNSTNTLFFAENEFLPYLIGHTELTFEKNEDGGFDLLSKSLYGPMDPEARFEEPEEGEEPTYTEEEKAAFLEGYYENAELLAETRNRYEVLGIATVVNEDGTALYYLEASEEADAKAIMPLDSQYILIEYGNEDFQIAVVNDSVGGSIGFVKH